MKNKLLLLLMFFYILSLGLTTPVTGDGAGKTIEVTSSNGVVHSVRFYSSNSTLMITSKNRRSESVSTGFAIEIDKYSKIGANFEIKPDDLVKHEYLIYDSVDVTRDKHSIIFSTYGNHSIIEFHKDINSTNPGPIPTPQITDVEVDNATVDDERSAVAYVTVTNPTNQLYSMKLMVHTLGTDGGLYGASVRPGRSRTIEVELLEEPGQTIAGEARLYVDRPSTRENALDQVEFVGRTDQETAVYNRTYQPITPPWEDNAYRYENGSVRDDGLLGTGIASGDNVPLALVVVVIVVLGLVVRRWRG